MCRVLNVSRSGYYYWLAQRPTKRTKENEMLIVLISDSFTASKKRYGSPKITRELGAKGIKVSRPRVARLMRKANLRSVIQKKYVVTTTDSQAHLPSGRKPFKPPVQPRKTRSGMGF